MYRDTEEHELYHYHSPFGVRDPVTAPAATLGDKRTDRAHPSAREAGERGGERGDEKGAGVESEKERVGWVESVDCVLCEGE